MYDPYQFSTDVIPIDIVIGAIKYVSLSSAYAGSLVIPLGLLLLFCPKKIRRSPIFFILTINLILGIALAFMVYIESIRLIQNPFEPPSKGVVVGSTTMIFIIPIFTDSALIFKLLRLFPSFQYSLWNRIVIIAFPILMTIPRLIIATLILHQLTNIYTSHQRIFSLLSFSTKTNLPLIEFALQLTSNSYCSITLLIKAYVLLYEIQQEEVYRSEVVMKRLKMMVRTLASSFLIPVCIQIALVIVFTISKNPSVREPIQWTNTYVSLHCAVLATVWSSIEDSTKFQPSSTQMNSKSRINSTGIVIKQSIGSFRGDLDQEEIMPKAYSTLTMQSLSPSMQYPRIPKERQVYQETMVGSTVHNMHF